MRRIYTMIGIGAFLWGTGISGMAQNIEEEVSAVVLPELMEQQQNITVFTRLLQQTGWDKVLEQSQDDSYVPVADPPTDSPVKPCIVPQTKEIAFTVFAENDEVFAANNITDAASLTEYLKQHYVFHNSDLLYDDQYTDPRHVVNQFVSYHLLPQAVSPKQLVIHYNEIDFDLNAYLETGIPQTTVPVYDYYETLGTPRRLLKIYESSSSDGFRLNRFARYQKDEFAEKEVIDEGISVSAEQSLEAENGYVYLLDEMLVYDKSTVDNFAERIRIDLASRSPELMNLGYRRPLDDTFSSVYCQPGFQDWIQVISGNLYYLSGFRKGWCDYQGDEFLLKAPANGGEVIIKLPPVPYHGMYQVRLGTSGNLSRGTVQYYFSEGDTGWQPLGYPVCDNVEPWYATNSSGYASYGWHKNSFSDPDVMLEAGNMMKAPASYIYGFGRGKPAREFPDIGRRILGNFFLESGKDYYIRIQSVHTEPSEIFLDYLELVPSEVFLHPSVVEDIW